MTVIYRCPRCGRETAMLTNAMETEVVRSLGVKLRPREETSTDHAPSSKCPFTGMIEDAYTDDGIAWTEAARTRAERIPVFARRMAMRGIEDYAREKGYREISESVLDEARGRLGL